MRRAMVRAVTAATPVPVSARSLSHLGRVVSGSSWNAPRGSTLSATTFPAPSATMGWVGATIPRRSMFIQTENTPNPSSLKFLPGVPVLPPEYGSGMFLQKGERDYQRSPLAVRLFTLEGVTAVFLGSDFITITKDKTEDWTPLKPQIFSIIMDAYAEGIEIMTEEPEISDTTILEDDDEIVAMIKELLETRIRPAVQEDGGDIFYVSFDHGTGVVQLQLAGSCQGCPSSSVTLKSGVENMLMHYIPEVTEVVAVDEDIAELEREQSAFEKKLAQAGIPSD